MTSRRAPDLPPMHFGEEANRLLAALEPVKEAVDVLVNAETFEGQVRALANLSEIWRVYKSCPWCSGPTQPGTSRICQRHGEMLKSEGEI